MPIECKEKMPYMKSAASNIIKEKPYDVIWLWDYSRDKVTPLYYQLVSPSAAINYSTKTILLQFISHAESFNARQLSHLPQKASLLFGVFHKATRLLRSRKRVKCAVNGKLLPDKSWLAIQKCELPFWKAC